MVEIFPQYDRYQERTKREIPVVVLTPIGGSVAGAGDVRPADDGG
jgi:hypothetical protein